MLVDAALETRTERESYHFENPSSFNPGPLVPHFFEQHYRAGAARVVVTVRYRWLGGPWSSELGVAAPATAPGSDVDTFLEPSGDVITSGTRGQVRLRAFSFQQRVHLSTWRAWTVGVTIGVHRSTADFLPADLIVTHSEPASESARFTTDRETTVSHVFETGVTASAPFDVGHKWQMTISADLLPITRARLRTSLPDKYPDMDIVAEALALGLRGRVMFDRSFGTVTIGLGVTTSGAWGYRETSRYSRRGAGALIRAGVALQ